MQEELDAYWESVPLGYNEDNDAYHMGKSIMVKKKLWDEYNNELAKNPDLDSLDFLVNVLKKYMDE